MSSRRNQFPHQKSGGARDMVAAHRPAVTPEVEPAQVSRSTRQDPLAGQARASPRPRDAPVQRERALAERL